MNEIVQRLIAKTGLSEDQASAAVQTVLGFVKEKLPAPLAAQVEGILGGGQAEETAGVGGALGSIGGMFGRR